MLQNHLLQVIACLAMDPPNGRDPDAHARRKDADFSRDRAARRTQTSVRGQFRGYRGEPGVAADSDVETFAALRAPHRHVALGRRALLHPRRQASAAHRTEVLVELKPPPLSVFDALAAAARRTTCASGWARRERSRLACASRAPAKRWSASQVELVAVRGPSPGSRPYERLLSDAMRGDTTLFAREESVEAAWRVVEPVLGGKTPLHRYEPGTWGPAGPIGRFPLDGWHNPENRRRG